MCTFSFPIPWLVFQILPVISPISEYAAQSTLLHRNPTPRSSPKQTACSDRKDIAGSLLLPRMPSSSWLVDFPRNSGWHEGKGGVVQA